MAGINHVAVKSSHDTGTAVEWNADHEQKGNHDCAKFQHLNHVVENRTSFPGGPVEGQVIYRSDQHTFYHWNGTVWVAIQGPATVVVAADGSGMTTDIQEGIDMLPASGGVVYIKEGTYVITVEITVTIDNVSIKGAGRSCIIESNANNIDMFSITGHDFTIDDVYIDGDNNLNNRGIYFDNVIGWIVRGCWFEHFSLACIYNQNGILSRNILITENWIEPPTTATEYAIYFDNAGAESVTGIRISNNTTDQYSRFLFFGSVRDGVIEGNNVRRCKRELIVMDNCYRTSVTGNVMTGGSEAAQVEDGTITIKNTSRDIVFSGNYISGGNDKDCIDVSANSSFINITGNNIHSSGGNSDTIELNGDDCVAVANVLGPTGAGLAVDDNGVGNEVAHNISV